MKEKANPNFPLETYRNFIRDAAAFVSLIVGRRVSATEAETISEDDLIDLALLIDARVSDINKRPLPLKK